ncbi:HutP family protein [Geochorda subterranea]|uniref:Hut operon positive regulatory protein n=1 Tax=Geochorda subterranea TaxID=3109564 RepID=A0ABZ1BSU5_9FIRM|nr:HutP family protein [Limnochorda sp. LNt]WRP15897.1 HutP family protein [Limnochorda sp. LNt]
MAGISESREVAQAALRMATSRDYAEESRLKTELKRQGILAAAVDFGGPFAQAIPQIVERCVVAAKREGLIVPLHSEEGAVAGAAHEAAMGLALKAMGLSVGGKAGLARRGEHVVVALFVAIGLGHLDDIAASLGHRALAHRPTPARGGGARDDAADAAGR